VTASFEASAAFPSVEAVFVLLFFEPQPTASTAMTTTIIDNINILFKALFFIKLSYLH
jgi:hypothetical protein